MFLVFVNLHYKATIRLFLILRSMGEGVKEAKITADILYAWSTKVLQLQSNMSHLGLVKRLSEACSTKKQLEKEQLQMPQDITSSKISIQTFSSLLVLVLAIRVVYK